MSCRYADCLTCRIILAISLSVSLGGCSDSTSTPAPVAKSAPVAASIDVPPVISAAELRRRLGTDERATFRRVGTNIVEAYLAGAGVQSIEALRDLPLKVLDLGFCNEIDDISVLQGMPLRTLILEGTSVADLTPLTGMSLETLHLQDTPVTDLSPIYDMPLQQLNLKGVAVSDVSPFASMPLSTLWLLETDVSDISALSSLRLESLDVQDTAVSDLMPLSKMTSLKRLNIAGTPVTDIRPVTGLRLERILLSPERITAGIDELRNIPSLGKIGTSHEHQFASADFWQRYDVGAWESTDSSTAESPVNEESQAPAGDADPPAGDNSSQPATEQTAPSADAETESDNSQSDSATDE